MWSPGRVSSVNLKFEHLPRDYFVSNLEYLSATDLRILLVSLPQTVSQEVLTISGDYIKKRLDF